MGDITPPPFLGQDNDLLWLLLIPAIIIVLTIAITCYLVEKNKNKKKMLLEQKKEPIIFINTATNDITILTLTKFLEIIVSISLYKNDILQKEFTIKELNFEENEQRVIANTKDFETYKIDYKIISCK